MRLPAALVFILLSSFAFGHEFYDAMCCDDKDCAPVPEGVVTLTREGYLVQPHNNLLKVQLVSFSDERLRVAPDGQYHTCLTAFNTLRCLYVPPASF